MDIHNACEEAYKNGYEAGQCTVTKFRLHEKTVETARIYHFEVDDVKECALYPSVNSETHQWELCLEELVLEQQGGII